MRGDRSFHRGSAGDRRGRQYGDVFTHNPHAHPELSRGNRMVVSYNVNTFDNVGDVYRDITIHRPRFVTVDFTW